jgi:hypothetical protein
VGFVIIAVLELVDSVDAVNVVLLAVADSLFRYLWPGRLQSPAGFTVTVEVVVITVVSVLLAVTVSASVAVEFPLSVKVIYRNCRSTDYALQWCS